MDFTLRPGGRDTYCAACVHRHKRERWANMTPEQKVLRREYQRIWTEGKRRAAGIPPRQFKNGKPPVERVFLPVDPIVREMTRFMLVHDEMSWRGLARMVGTGDRALWRLRHRESRHIRVDLADRIAVAIGTPLALIYPSEDER